MEESNLDGATSSNKLTSTGRNSQADFPRLFITLFIIVALASWAIGAVGAQNELNNNWKLPGFTVSTLNSDFETADSKASCNNATDGGCGIIQINSKHDCSVVQATADGYDSKGKTTEIVEVSHNEVTRGVPFSLEFDLKLKSSTQWDLTQLECAEA